MKKLPIIALLIILVTMFSLSSIALSDTDFVNAHNPHKQEALDFINHMDTTVKMPTNMNNVPNYDATKYHNKVDHTSQDFLDKTKSDGERLRSDPNNMAGQINNISKNGLSNKQDINPGESFLKSSNNVTGDLDHHYPWTEEKTPCTPKGTSATQGSSSANKCYMYNNQCTCNNGLPEPKEDPAMSGAITQLGSALHMGKQMVGQGGSMEMFSGQVNSCRKVSNGLNCCRARSSVSTSLKEVWGKGIDNIATGRAIQNVLMACKENEKVLQLKRSKDLAIEIGGYCKHRMKVFGITVGCLEHEYVYCTFENKLSKVFQVQARKQLHMGFGSANNPKCGGLTKEQFASIDMSKMDFSSYTKDIENNIQHPSGNDMGKSVTNAIGNFYKQHPNIQH